VASTAVPLTRDHLGRLLRAASSASEWQTSAVADVKDDDRIRIDGEQHAIKVRFTPINELANFEGKFRALRSEAVAMGQLTERIAGAFEIQEPTQAGFACMLRQ